MKKIDGKELANKILRDLKKKVAQLDKKPGLAVILANNDPSSFLYVQNKKRAARKTGIRFELYKYASSNITNELMLARIKKLNKRKDIHGIIIQLPLPKHLDADKIIVAIDPGKDVDGFHPKTRRISPVTLAVIKLLEATKKNFKNKRAVLFVKTETFARPIRNLLESAGIKTQIILKPTAEKLKKYAKESDVVIIALGKPYVLKSKMIKDGAVVIDIGITSRGKSFIGDFDWRKTENKKGFYTPVPGGIGPITVAMLLENVVKASQLK